MSYVITAIDRDALPAALLPIAKRHLRITFADDDADITEKLQWSIAYCEKVWGSRVFPAEVDWSPVITNASRYQCPLQPIASFTVMSASVDVSAEYELETGAPVDPVWLVHIDGTPFPADAAIGLVAGVADPDDMDPGERGSIVRLAATLYEYRETVTGLSLDHVPQWINDLIVGSWIPRI